MSELRGMPLLSGPPPIPSGSEDSCRKCNKEFNILFTRSRRCNHCGYSYCSSCSDYQALMPRAGGMTGYDPMPVCAFCIEFLNMTATGKARLRSLPLAKLKRYLDAYHIQTKGAIEKDDLIDVMIKSRESNGCLPAANEAYYRRYSVPNKPSGRPRGLFSRTFGHDQARPSPRTPQRSQSQPQPAFARPDLAPDFPPEQQQPPSPPQQWQRTSPPPPTPRPQPFQNQPSNISPYQPPHSPPPPHQDTPRQSPPSQQSHRPTASYSSTNIDASVPQASSPPRQRATSTTSAPPAQPVPTLDELLQMTHSQMQTLSVHSLKEILYRNRVNARLIIEKADLVEKVVGLVEQEKRDREHEAILRAQEEEELQERQRVLREELNAKRERESRQTQGTSGSGEGGQEGSTSAESSSKPLPPTPKTQAAMAATLERTGLCVICQDEEANIAVVDCGHLCMCRGCSDLVMGSSRECPLCRTRIVTEARLLRIFKT
ncbi:hypothetical protein JAAARDRAFT_176824 [Jaapia argillacea MUCL 33604]|uniref:RING-type domain-containing protein n=1 Tax=Jaapia argillacea MUCL 33604 TaxID=933084 RepID=A0A067PXX8_9AGAM|nr:hypothetical protein JAAARDRAFT_176824 [Jaapia argillacea MUCL 33604]